MQQEALILQVLWRKPTSRVPVWAMRQAGRVLARYRKLRAEIGDFKHMISHPELATQITLLPVEDLGVDAAIIFSDILVVPEAMGFPYTIHAGQGPYFRDYIQKPDDVARLRPLVPEESLSYVLEALRLTRRALPAHIPLIGFSAAPWTLLAYLLEGAGSRSYSRARRFLYQHPQAAHHALQQLSTAIVAYLSAQGRSGADCLQIFDTLAEVLPPSLYAEFGLPYLKQVAHALQHRPPPLLVFVKGAHYALKALAELPCAGLSIDWMTPIATARRILAPYQKIIQGNFDPALLYAPRSHIIDETQALLQAMKDYPYIANLGHGVYPDTPEENLRLWVETVQAYPNKP